MERPLATLLITHLDQLYDIAGDAPRSGPRQRALSPTADGAVAAVGERIVAAGRTDDVLAAVSIDDGTTVVDGRGRSLVPGFVDPHTHVIFAGDRRDELRLRLAGANYADIAAAGGGILSTVRATRAATDDDLAKATAARLSAMLAAGTTTCEAKSGYGLTTDSEVQALRVLRRLNDTLPIDVVTTFMGAHEVPPEYRGRQADYVRLVIEEMVPAAAPHADWCDVFCDTGFFTPDESRRILDAGRAAGMKPRIHADELASSGGSLVAEQTGCRSADHLVFADADGIAALARGGVVATLLPCAAFYLKLGRMAPARAMIEAGVAVALATDVNPGGGFSTSMPFAMTLGCFAMGLTFEEALTAATINAAYAIDRHDSVGSLESGKLMDAVLVEGPAVNLVRGNNPGLAAVFKRGRQVSATV